MKHVLLTLTILCLGVQSLASAAACSDTQCSGQISVLYVTAQGDAYVGLVGGLAGLTGCIPNSGAQEYLTVSASSRNMKMIYATLLSAQMAGRSVTIYADANSNGCTIKHMTSP